MLTEIMIEFLGGHADGKKMAWPPDKEKPTDKVYSTVHYDQSHAQIYDVVFTSKDLVKAKFNGKYILICNNLDTVRPFLINHRDILWEEDP